MGSRDWMFTCVRHLCFGNKWYNVHFRSVSPIYPHKRLNISKGVGSWSWVQQRRCLQPFENREWQTLEELPSKMVWRAIWNQHRHPDIQSTILSNAYAPQLTAFHVDDFVICCQATHMNIIERQFQLNLNKINKWATDNGFKFLKSKTQCVHFWSLRKMHKNPEDTEIPIVSECKFLEVIFDKKQTFIPHIKYLKTKSTWAQQLLRVVAHTEWGADRQTPLKLYRSLIRSQLDDAIFRSYLKQFDPIHHEGLRQILEAFRTSPIDNLYAEAHEVSLQLRCEKLALHKTRILLIQPNLWLYLQPEIQAIFWKKKEKVNKTFWPSYEVYSPRR